MKYSNLSRTYNIKEYNCNKNKKLDYSSFIEKDINTSLQLEAKN